MNKFVSIVMLSMGLLFSACSSNNEQIITKINLNVKAGYEGYIVIYYNQPKTKGNMEYREGEHYVQVPDDGVIFTGHKLGKVAEVQFVNAKGEEIDESMLYDEIRDDELCIGCWGGRGSMEDSLGKDIVITSNKMGLKKNVKRMKVLDNSDLQDIYYGRKTGELKYWTGYQNQ